MDHDLSLDAFCVQVGELVTEYGVEDGADLCRQLIDAGVIDPNGMGLEYAARCVAQHVKQA